MNDITPAHERTPWISIILAILAFIAFVASTPEHGGMRSEWGYTTMGMPPSAGAPSVQYDMGMDNAMAPYYPARGVPATDTREFLKTSYNAAIETRDVDTLTKRVETIVRGHKGRVDQMTSGEKYGYVQFAVPASELAAFRDEIEGLVGPRFITIQVGSQNLLPQKVSIEERQKIVDDNLASLKNTRATLVANHASAAKSLQAQIDGQTVMLSDLREQPQSTDRDIQIQQLEAVLIDYTSRLTNENFSYTPKLASIDAQIKNAETVVTAVKTQDQDLLDSVATVEGGISLSWISLWDLARLYLPGYTTAIILALLSAISYISERRLWIFRRV